MLDKLYKTVQGILNKDQLGDLKPLHFNLFIHDAQIEVWNDLLLALKTNVRKQNWHLDGKDFANIAEHHQQLLEHFSEAKQIVGANTQFNPPLFVFVLPSDLIFVEDVFANNIRVDKVSFTTYNKLQTNMYAKPNVSQPICAKVGDHLRVSPSTITGIDLHYLRLPKTPKWTFEEVEGKPMFDATASDYQDIDMPENLFDKLTSLVTEMASMHLRDLPIAQLANQEQAQDVQAESKQ